MQYIFWWVSLMVSPKIPNVVAVFGFGWTKYDITVFTGMVDWVSTLGQKHWLSGASCGSPGSCVSILYFYIGTHKSSSMVYRQTWISPPHLSTWITQINFVRGTFTTIMFWHIFREKNQVADSLSKLGIADYYGTIHYTSLEGETISVEGSFLLP